MTAAEFECNNNVLHGSQGHSLSKSPWNYETTGGNKKHSRKSNKNRNKKHNSKSRKNGGNKLKKEFWVSRSDVNKLKPGESCPICLESFGVETHDAIYNTNCGHLFHNNCLHSVCENYNKNIEPECPICRTQIQSFEDGPQDCMSVFAFKEYAMGDNPELGNKDIDNLYLLNKPSKYNSKKRIAKSDSLQKNTTNTKSNKSSRAVSDGVLNKKYKNLLSKRTTKNRRRSIYTARGKTSSNKRQTRRKL